MDLLDARGRSSDTDAMIEGWNKLIDTLTLHAAGLMNCAFVVSFDGDGGRDDPANVDTPAL